MTLFLSRWEARYSFYDFVFLYLALGKIDAFFAKHTCLLLARESVQERLDLQGNVGEEAVCSSISFLAGPTGLHTRLFAGRFSR